LSITFQKLHRSPNSFPKVKIDGFQMTQKGVYRSRYGDWITPAILATWEAEIRRIGQPEQKVDPSQQIS
jgi:hypothetical protein